MKKTIFLLVAILLIYSCKKEKDPPTTYQVMNNSAKYQSDIEFLDGSIYQVTIFHYSGTDVVKQDNVVKLAYGGGKSELIDVPGNSQKIRVSFKLLPPESPFSSLSSNHWLTVVAYTTVKQGQNNIISIDGNTITQNSLGVSNLGNDLIKTGRSFSSQKIE